MENHDKLNTKVYKQWHLVDKAKRALIEGCQTRNNWHYNKNQRSNIAAEDT